MSDFKGFRFGNIHIKDLHLTVVSSGDRFNKNLLPDPTDYSVDVPGGNGKYYFGQTHNSRTMSVKTAFDNLDEYTIRKIRQIFATDKLKDLVFDEEPYKVYRAKLSRAPAFNYVCFLNKETNQRVYKGECDFDFVMYHPYAFCFNKYIVRAADYYKCTPPELIIKPSEDTYAINNPVPPLERTIKEQYKTINNMETPWKGGYPTIEQVQNGELFFDTPNGTKTIIDVRNYWDNIPRWQTAAKLLTTPTLDYDQELIYMPQYSKIRYYNMDIGINEKNSALGSRLLVYNPGDIPIDFKLNFGNLKSQFRGLDNYTFRISRYNVQRLTIDQAVDWTGLKTYLDSENDGYKYGTRYFKILKQKNKNQKLKELENIDPSELNSDMIKNLNYSHPNHCYIAEPIPQEKLGYFIRLFYKQSNLLLSQNNIHFLNCEDGERYASRYEELRELCITEEEKNELYWKTLKEAIYDRYKEYNDSIEDSNKKIFDDDNYTYEDFVYDMIYNPQEYIRQANDLSYGKFNFNLISIPTFCTFDYLDISSKNFDKIENCSCYPDTEIRTLTLDSEARLLYNKEESKWDINDSTLKDNFYNPDKIKVNFNDNIIRGHWFQLPPGWSLIDISPVVDEDTWGGKRWLDARPFLWGTTNQEERDNYDKIYYKAIELFLNNFYPNRKPQDTTDWGIDNWENLIHFRLWEGDFREETKENVLEYLNYSIKKYKVEKYETQFLKFLNDCFNYYGVDINEWWWNSNNYMWVNYPPLYWGFVDLLNRAKIEYIPQYY